MAQLHRGRRLMGEINVVPYIDVMLVLLIIFMVTAPLLAQGVKVDLPKAAAEPLPPDAQEPLVLSIDRQGRMFLNVGATPNVAITEEVLTARATAALRRNPDRAVLLKADENIPYGRAVDAMVILQHAGAQKVGFITQPLATRKPMGATEQPTAGIAAEPPGVAAAPGTAFAPGVASPSGTAAAPATAAPGTAFASGPASAAGTAAAPGTAAARSGSPVAAPAG